MFAPGATGHGTQQRHQILKTQKRHHGVNATLAARAFVQRHAGTNGGPRRVAPVNVKIVRFGAPAKWGCIKFEATTQVPVGSVARARRQILDVELDAGVAHVHAFE